MATPRRKINYEEWDLRTLPKDERPPPTSGQSGHPLELDWSVMNGDERKVAEKLANAQERMMIKTLAESGFGRDKANANLRVRNALRRLVRGEWVKKVKPGVYKLGPEGRAHMSARAEKKGANIVSINKSKK